MTGDTTVYLSRAYHARTYHRDADCRYLADDYRETTKAAVIASERFDDPELEWIVTEALRKEGYETVNQGERVQELLASGLSPSEATDFVNTAEGEYTQTQWARIRDISQQAVSENVAKARAKLDGS